MRTTITVADFLKSGAPKGFSAFLPTFNGEERVGYIRTLGSDLWAVCPDANAGFGLSFAVHKGTELRIRPA